MDMKKLLRCPKEVREYVLSLSAIIAEKDAAFARIIKHVDDTNPKNNWEGMALQKVRLIAKSAKGGES